MKDFNIAKYLKENHLGSHGILGKYVDLHGLKEEEDYGNNKPVDEVPYVGTDAKLDGFGDEFDQIQPVSELEKPEQIYSNDWMNDDVDGKRVGNWTCYFEDQMGVLYWIHDKILSEDVVVYATPNWENAKGIAVEVQVDYGGYLADQDTIGDPSYPDFDSYAEDMAPFLKKVEDKYFAGEYDKYLDGKEEMEEEVAVSSSGVEMEELEKPEKIYRDEEDSADQGDMERIYEVFEYQLQRLVLDIIDDGYGPEDAAQFLRDYANHIDKGGIK